VSRPDLLPDAVRRFVWMSDGAVLRPAHRLDRDDGRRLRSRAAAGAPPGAHARRPPRRPAGGCPRVV